MAWNKDHYAIDCPQLQLVRPIGLNITNPGSTAGSRRASRASAERRCGSSESPTPACGFRSSSLALPRFRRWGAVAYRLTKPADRTDGFHLRRSRSRSRVLRSKRATRHANDLLRPHGRRRAPVPGYRPRLRCPLGGRMSLRRDMVQVHEHAALSDHTHHLVAHAAVLNRRNDGADRRLHGSQRAAERRLDRDGGLGVWE